MKTRAQISPRTITITALFAAIATLVMYLEMPLPLMPPFLKVDLSCAVILIGAYILGVKPAIWMALIKDVLHSFSTQTGYVGELADFLMTLAFILVATAIFRRYQSRKGAIAGCAAGTLAMSCAGMLTNAFLLIPFYSNIMPMEAIWSACRAVNPIIVDLRSYIFFGAFPFNLVKGAIVSLVTVLLYQKLGQFIRQQSLKRPQPSEK